MAALPPPDVPGLRPSRSPSTTRSSARGRRLLAACSGSRSQPPPNPCLPSKLPWADHWQCDDRLSRSRDPQLAHQFPGVTHFLHKSANQLRANHSRARSPWAQAYYQLCLDRGDGHNTALRKLAWKWQRILFRSWKSEEPYDEEKYVASLSRSGSPIAAKIQALKDAA